MTNKFQTKNKTVEASVFAAYVLVKVYNIVALLLGPALVISSMR